MLTVLSEQELLMDAPVAAPLFAGGVRCHGGFDNDGRYLPPRTLYRTPAIEAWQEKHRRDFGTEIIDVPLSTWPAHYPSVEQARLLLRRGVPEPLIATLTRIGTVEGFGANIRHLRPGDLQRHFAEDISGTATAHLGRGLFEAHGRDEAGWEEQAGHKDMWFAARDIAFEGRSAEVDIDAMLARMGFERRPAGAGEGRGPTGAVAGERLLPDDIDADLEAMVRLMVRVLLIEISAFHTFAWAEEWLADTDLVAGEGEAARLVGFIRMDETPHVGYLRAALTEMRDRTWLGASGHRYPGVDMIGVIWEHSLRQSLGPGRAQNLQAVKGEVEHWCSRRPGGGEVLEEFLALSAGDAH
ncbi:MAG TPA: hypothetical protein VKU88_06095 [Acidimicrobiales bacterium]|nr:hypothetical protein [Acidimicrobiales bacterium]